MLPVVHGLGETGTFLLPLVSVQAPGPAALKTRP